MSTDEFIIEGNTLVRYDGVDKNVVIPAGITAIAPHAFEENRIMETIDLADVKTIGELAFRWCRNLTKVYAPNVIEVGERAFWNCEMTHVTFGKIQKVCEEAFLNCSMLETVDGCEHLTYIERMGFGGCHRLRALQLGKTAEFIGGGAFWCCGKIERFTVPDGIKTLESCVFSGCSSLSSVELPEGLELIKDGAFFGCYALKRIDLPTTVKKIERGAFARCHVAEVHNDSELDIVAGKGKHGDIALHAIAVYSSVKDGDSETVGDFVFCTDARTGVAYLTEYRGHDVDLVLPRDYHGGGYEINRLVFDEADIRSVDLGDGVTAIGNLAFHYCKRLTKIVFGKNLRRIDRLAFKLCEGLECLELPDGVEELGYGAFCRTGLEYIVIGKGLKTVRTEVFSYCRNLKKVYFRGTLQELEETLGAKYLAQRFEHRIYCYSETSPTDPNGAYWHYVDGKIVEY